MDNLLNDLRFAARMLRKSPLVTGAAVLSLALALGANTTLFTLVNAVFLRGLPVEEPERLITIHTEDTGMGLEYLPVSRPNYLDLRNSIDQVSGTGHYFFTNANLRFGDGEPQQMLGRMVSSNYFTLLGVSPQIGRLFTDEGNDEVPGSEPVIVLSHGTWTRQMGSDPDVLGKTVYINQAPFTVIGVTQPGFTGLLVLQEPAFWVPVSMHESVLTADLLPYYDHRRALLSNVFARLAPSVSVDTARQAIQRLGKSLEEEYPDHNVNRGFQVVTLPESMLGPNQRDVFLQAGGLMMLIVGLVLLVACANVANLLLARAASRRREIAVRLALGAPRARIVRQLLAESLLLALVAGGLGLLFAHWAKSAAWSLRPPFLANTPLDLSFDPRVLGFTLLLTVVTGLLFGLAPSLQATRRDLVSDLMQTADTAAGMSRIFSFRNLLVIGQVAFSLVALIGSGLFLRSLSEANRIDLGFEPQGLALLTFSPSLAGLGPVEGEQVFERVTERVQSLPGVEEASLTSAMPMLPGGAFQRTVLVENRDPEDENNAVLVPVITTDVGFFQTLGIELLQGRRLGTEDRADTVPVAVINRAMADRFWPEEDALGKRFNFLGDPAQREVVGIVETTKFLTLGEEPQPLAYLPRKQSFAPNMTLVARTGGDPAAMIGTLSRAVREIEPNLALTNLNTAEAAVQQALWAPRTAARLLALLGLLALVLATLGIYGVMSYTVGQRRREISIHMAMGADRSSVLKLILSQGLRVVAVGLVLGCGVALIAAQAITALLYGVPPSDPITYLITLLILSLVALGANLLPALRATSVPPTAVLQFER